MNYQYAVDHILKNGEPGFAWIENMKDYSRMWDPPDYKDKNAAGGNPWLEQTLESYEMWTLVETFPDHHSSYLEFQDTLELAYLYAKTVTLGLTNCDLSNEVMTRNRRIGWSMSGIAQFISNRGVNHLKNWWNRGYDFLRKYDDFISNQFNVSKSIKMTSIKPSGTVSLLAGATPGLHFPESQFYIRRVRLSKENEMIPILERAGYKIEEDVYTPNTYCVEVPVSLGSKIRTLWNVSMWEQLSLAAFLQKYWADNQVSWTVTFDPKTESDSLKPALEYFQYQLKGISFLPKASNSYAQMPYEKITKEEYQKLSQKVSKIELSKELVKSSVSLSDPKPENYWDSSSCSV